ncbi:MAG: AAA family ATPase [Patescibacteria group bacterium]
MNSSNLSDFQKLRKQAQDILAPHVISSERLIDLYLVSLLAGGHLLLVGPPGVAKTRSASLFSQLLSLEFKRVQFTPDLLPSDITGVEIYDPKKQEFFMKKGPIFASFVLADEINRAPSKVQSALLEAMQEMQVTIGTASYSLPDPFFVVATMNPLDGQGTYPLPEASLDRFLLSYRLEMPTLETEIAIMKQSHVRETPILASIIDTQSLVAMRKSAEHIVFVDEKIIRYIARLVTCTRDSKMTDFAHGISPRGSIALLSAVRIYAALKGRDYVIPEDVKELAPHILEHRVSLSYEALSVGKTNKSVIADLLATVSIE